MVFHVGVNFLVSRVFLYNSADKVVNEFEIKRVSGNDIDKTDAIFSTLKSIIFGELGCICFLLPWYAGFGNKIRERLICSGLQEGFKNVEILDVFSARYIAAISQSGFKIKNDEILWMFEGTRCFIWKKIEDKAVLIYDGNQDMLEDKNVEHIKKLSKQDQSPKYILCNTRIDKGLLKHVSQDAKIFYYRKKWRTSALTKARIMAGDPDVIDYDTNATITYPAVIKIGGKKFMDFYQEISSPSIRAIHIELENGADNVLSILTGTHESEEIELPALKEFVLTVTMDTSGIYNVHYHKPSVNKSTLENLYLQADNYIKKKSLDYFIPQVMQTNCVDVVGIDFGASKCCVAVNRNSGMETIPLDNTGERNLPSYIAFEEKHNKCGKIVINRLWYCEKSAVFDTKLIIGKKYDEVKHDGSWPFKLIKMNNNPALLKDNHFRPQDYYTMIQFQGYEGEALKYPEEISSILLKYIKEKAEEFQGKKLSEAVITVPATFTDTQKKATFVAGLLAGWEKIDLLPEPMAAIFGYSKNATFSDGEKILIFDLGGCSLNVYIVKIEKDQIILKVPNTNYIYIGKSFDNVLKNYFSERLKTECNIANLSEKRYTLISECQKIKEDLSTINEAMIDVDEFDPSKEGHLTITRQDFENLATELLEGIKTTILETLEKSGYKSNDINKVLQVGGGCRMPMIKNLLQNIFNDAEHLCDNHHDEIVAIGAALYAYDTNNKRTEIMIAADNRGHFVNQERSDLKTITTDVSLDTEEPFQHCVNQKYEKFKSEKSEHSVIDLSDDKTVKSDIKSLKSNITIK